MKISQTTFIKIVVVAVLIYMAYSMNLIVKSTTESDGTKQIARLHRNWSIFIAIGIVASFMFPKKPTT